MCKWSSGCASSDKTSCKSCGTAMCKQCRRNLGDGTPVKSGNSAACGKYLKICSREEYSSKVQDIPSPSGCCYFVRFVNGEFGFALASNIQPLNELSLEQVLKLAPTKYSNQITNDYSIVKDQKASNKVAHPQSKLVVKMTKRTKGVDELIEIVAGVKRNFDETNEIELGDTVPDDFVDDQELWEILQVYSLKGFMGILERFGMTFRNLQFPLNKDEIKPNTIAHQILTKNSTLPIGLKEYLGDFLTSFGMQFSTYKSTPVDEDLQHFCNTQYEKAKLFSSILENTKHSLQYRILRLSEDNIFLPLFKLKNIIHSKTDMAKTTFQEYFSMIFKRYHIFSNKDNGFGVFFKTCERIDSKSLKLSINIMNKKWVEDVSRIHSDFVLMHSSNFIHYFAIGEFENTSLNASTAEEFLCAHKDTIKIILEGRSVLKDIAYSLAEKEIDDEVKKNLLIRLFLIDTAGKVVILKISPVFPSIHSELHGILYKISYSPLLDLFSKEDFFTIFSEIDDCVKMATNFDYPSASKCQIRSICPTPITIKSMSAIGKIFSLPTIRLKSFRITFFNTDDEQKLFNFLEERFPNLTIFKTEQILDSSDLSLLDIMVSKVGDKFEFNTTSDSNIHSNPILVGYPILLNNALFVQVIELTNTEIVLDVNILMSDEEEISTNDNKHHDHKDTHHGKDSDNVSPQRNTSSNSHSFQNLCLKLKELTFKSWKLGIPQRISIHSQDHKNYIKSYTRYVCYCECEYLPKQINSFVKICSSTRIESTFNLKIISSYVELSQKSSHPNLIKIYGHFLADIGIPYSVFGIMSAPPDYETSITISEILIPFSKTKLSRVENLNSKLLIVFYIIDGCIRGSYHLLKEFNILHNDLFKRNVMFRRDNGGLDTSALQLVERECGILNPEHVVLADLNNCVGFTKILMKSELMDMANMFIDLLVLVFNFNPMSETKNTSLEEWKHQFNFQGDFRLLQDWIINLITNFKKNQTFISAGTLNGSDLSECVCELEEKILYLLERCNN